jgi:hypothetical protein
MKVGDLVKFKDHRGYSWWADKLYVCISREIPSPHWVKLLSPDGDVIEVTEELVELV